MIIILGSFPPFSKLPGRSLWRVPIVLAAPALFWPSAATAACYRSSRRQQEGSNQGDIPVEYVLDSRYNIYIYTCMYIYIYVYIYIQNMIYSRFWGFLMYEDLHTDTLEWFSRILICWSYINIYIYICNIIIYIYIYVYVHIYDVLAYVRLLYVSLAIYLSLCIIMYHHLSLSILIYLCLSLSISISISIYISSYLTNNNGSAVSKRAQSFRLGFMFWCLLLPFPGFFHLFPW